MPAALLRSADRRSRSARRSSRTVRSARGQRPWSSRTGTLGREKCLAPPPWFRPARPSSSHRAAGRPEQAAPTARATAATGAPPAPECPPATQQLDVRVAPDHAGRRARHVEQDAVERPTVPPGGGLAPRRRPLASPTNPNGAGSRVTRVRRSGETSTAISCASSGCSSSRWPVLPPGAAQASRIRSPGRGSSSRAPSCAAASCTETTPSSKPGKSATSMASASSSASSSNMLVATAMPLAARLRPILRSAGAEPIHANPERRSLIVGSENCRGLLAPISARAHPRASADARCARQYRDPPVRAAVRAHAGSAAGSR